MYGKDCYPYCVAATIDGSLLPSPVPGSEKTTLLRQMTADAAVNPLGIDAVVRCGPDDDDLSVFAGRIRAALGLDALPLADVASEAKAITRSFTAASPTNVCLVVDDLHKLTPGSPSMALLAAILDRLPATGHLAFFSRSRPELPFARELANGTALMLTDADLAFTEDEWAAAVDANNTPLTVGSSQATPPVVPAFTPWPALAALVASSTDPAVSVDYVWQEVPSDSSARSTSAPCPRSDNRRRRCHHAPGGGRIGMRSRRPHRRAARACRPFRMVAT